MDVIDFELKRFDQWKESLEGKTKTIINTEKVCIYICVYFKLFAFYITEMYNLRLIYRKVKYLNPSAVRSLEHGPLLT